MVLVMIASGGGTCNKGGLHDNNMMTLMTIHHTTISYRKEGRKRCFEEEVDDGCGRMTNSCGRIINRW
jgi:hypothetical protein